MKTRIVVAAVMVIVSVLVLRLEWREVGNGGEAGDAADNPVEPTGEERARGGLPGLRAPICAGPNSGNWRAITSSIHEYLETMHPRLSTFARQASGS